MQQDVGPGGHMFAFGFFNLIVTNAVLAWDKYHCRWRYSGDVNGIMTSTGYHVAVAIA